MVDLKSVTKEVASLESMPVLEESRTTVGSAGSASAEESRSRRLLVASGKSGPIGSPLESVIGTDERVRILDTELSPWRRICALRMRAPSGAMAHGHRLVRRPEDPGDRRALRAQHPVLRRLGETPSRSSPA